ncbi:MAG: CD225/dispanin family protein [Flavobacteriaceae bacterium]|nr:CD225/dispanin family protein [Flavobacteriaceae bacterium]MCB0474019.1 CD225/dispanin family protein [Flavobacteriaceae bacterium]
MNSTAEKPKNYLVESILVTLLCCLPLGIVGIIFASQVNSKYDAGDIDGAIKASKDAKKFMTWGLIAGIILVVLYLIFIVGIGGLAILNSSN